MTIFEALGHDRVSGGPRGHQQTIETVISYVFMYPHEVWKVYKHENGFVGDLTNDAFRQAFVREDFAWNNAMCPEIYQRLVGLRLAGDTWEVCPTADAGDLAIVMRRISMDDSLYHRLMTEHVTTNQVADVATTMLTRLMALTKAKQASIKTFQRPWSELHHLRLQDLREWCSLDGANIEPTFLAEVLTTLEKLAQDPYIQQFRSRDMHVGIDNHTGNILITTDGVELLDIYQFKDHWLAVDPWVNITRPAADIAVLGDSALLDAYLTAAAALVPRPPRQILTGYLIEGAMIMAAYRNMLGELETATRFIQYVREQLSGMN
ncbi:MAG: hypothetical protein HY975_03905 [Candidatus Kerfeldbacteria bacterium]|nr:hypothetical protein [Candidatus Kerfeldbacteria bacterium]